MSGRLIHLGPRVILAASEVVMIMIMIVMELTDGIAEVQPDNGLSLLDNLLL